MFSFLRPRPKKPAGAANARVDYFEKDVEELIASLAASPNNGDGRELTEREKFLKDRIVGRAKILCAALRTLADVEGKP